MIGGYTGRKVGIEADSMSKSSISPHPKAGTRGLIQLVVLSLALSLLTVIAGQAPAQALASNQCMPITDASATDGYDSGDIKITPLHGQTFYVDLKNGLNASYIGYSIKNDKATAIDELWLEVADFRSTGTSVLSLSNPSDSFQPIGKLSAGATKNVFILVKTSGVTVTTQTHDVRIHQGYPGGDSTIYRTSGTKAECYYNFGSVSRTIAANANKVTSISIDDASPDIGGTVTVTINGATGTPGSGTSSIDGSIMWLSGASTSAWPTQALRLESTNLSVKYRKTSTPVDFPNTLILKTISTGVNGGAGSTKFTTATTYSATFTFRVMGGAAQDADVKPVAQIASGTQIKHTGQYPAPQKIKLTNTVTSISSVKSVVSVGSLSGGYYPVNYRIVLTDSSPSTPGKTLDAIIDTPESNVLFSTGTATITDATRTAATLLDPVDEDATSAKRLVFGGPFTFPAGGTITLNYTMRLPNILNNTYHNSAYARIGSKIVGQSNGNITVCQISIPSSGSPTNSCSEELPPKQDQVIDFTQPPTQGVGVNYTLDATASSGLPVTFASNTMGVCTVSGDVVTIIAEGTCSITASQSGNTSWNAATTVTRTFTVIPGQVISFTTPATMTVSQVKTDVAVSSSVGFVVTVTSLTTDVCTISSNTSTSVVTVTAVAAGQCVLVASHPGGTINGVTYGSAQDVERTIFVGASQEIVFTTTIANGRTGPTGSATLAARSRNSSTLADTDLVITYVSKTPDVCTAGEVAAASIGGNGLLGNSASGISSVTVSWTSNGLCIISANQDGFNDNGGNSGYAPAAEVLASFTIGTNVPIVSITSPASVNSAATSTITVTITTPSGYPTATASMTGTVNLFASGTRIPTSASQSQNISVTVSKATGYSYSFSVTAGTLAAGAANESYELTAEFITADGAVFSSASTQSANLVTVLAPTPVPTAVTLSASSITTNSATLSGSFHPQSATSTTASMNFGTSSTPSTSDKVGSYSTNTSSSNAPQNFSGTATGLLSATRYYFQAKATQTSANGTGSVLSFMTLPATPTFTSITPGANTATIDFNGVSSGPTVNITYYLSCTSTGNPTITSNVTSSPFYITGLLSSPSGVSYSCTITARATNSDPSVLGGGYGATSTATAFTTSPQKLDRTAVLATSSASVVYGSTITSTVTGTGADAAANTDGTKSVLQTAGAGTCSVSSLVISGEKVGLCTLTGSISEGTTYKLVQTSTQNVTVTQKPLTITAGSLSIATGSTYPGDSFSKTSLAFSDVLSDVTFSYYNSDGTGPLNSAPTNAGTYIIRPSDAVFTTGDASNYLITYIDGSLVISTGKTSHTITFNALLNKEFGETDEQNLPTVTSASRNISFLVEDPLICEVTGIAGSYKIKYLNIGTCTVTASSAGDATYFDATAAAGSQLTRSFTITARAITLTAARTNYEYGSEGSNSFSNSTLKTGDEIGSVTYSYYDSTGEVLLGSAPTSVGSYKVRASSAQFTSGKSNNYVITYTDGTFTVSAKSITLTVGSPSKTFGEVTPNNSFSTTTMVGSDAIGSVTYTYYDSSNSTAIGSTPTAAGTYKIRATSPVFSTGNSSNYSISYVVGTYTINTLATVITVGNQSITYGQSTPTNTFTPSAVATGDSISSVTYTYYDSTGTTPLASAPTSAGTYKIRASLPIFSVGSSSNYTISFSDGTFTISKKNHKITFTTSTLSAKTFGDVNEQDLPNSTDANRAVSFVVNDATTCEITGSSGTYKVKYLKVGTCTVTASSLGDDNFYDATAAVGSALSQSFVISALSATITVSSQTITAGDATPTNAFTRSSLAGTDEIGSVTYSYYNSAGTTLLGSAPTTAGTYKIRASAPVFSTGSASNYTLSFVDGTFTINSAGKLNHKIIFRNTDVTNKTFGTDQEQNLPTKTDANRNISYTTNDPEICTITGSAGAYKVKYLKVGTCVVTANGPGDDTYNDATADTGSALTQSFVVSAKNLSITSADKTMTFGGSRPDNSFSRTDLFSDDEISSVSFTYYDLDGNLLASPPTNAGTYKIRSSNPTFSKGSRNNYNISYVDGTLTISKKDRTIEVDPITDLTDWSSATPTIALTISAGDTDGTKSYELDPTSTGCTINASTGAITITKQGVCKVIANIKDGSNHNNATSVARSFTIGKKTQILTLPDTSLTISAGEQTLNASSNATTNNSDLGGYTYEIDTTVGNPASTSGCTVNANKLTFTQAGDCYVKVSRNGNADFWTNASTIARYIISNKTSRTIRIKDSTEAGSSSSYRTAGYTSWAETPPTLVTAVSAGLGDGNETFELDPSSSGCALDAANPGNGVVSFTGAGTCKVKVTISEGTNHGSAVSSLIEFTIGKRAQQITFPGLANKTDGDSTDQDLPSTTDVGRNISYSVDNPAVCSIVGSAGNYKVRYVGTGTCNVTASETGNGNYHGANASAGSSLTRGFTISARPPREEAIVVKSRSIKILDNKESGASSSFNKAGYSSWDETPPVLVSKVTDGESEGTKTYSLDPTSKGCAVDLMSGAVKFVSAGTCKIKVTISAANNYNAATSTLVSFEIGKRNHQIDLPKIEDKPFSASIKAESLPAATNAQQPIKYRTNDSAICEITGESPNFSVTPKRAGVCTVFAESGGDDNYNPASPAPNSSLVRSFTIAPKPLVITAENKNITFGQVLPKNTFVSTELVGKDSIGTVIYSYFDSTGQQALSRIPTDAGEYIIRITSTIFSIGEASNYSITYEEAKLTISKRPRTVAILPIMNLRNTSVKQLRFNFSLSTGRTDGQITFALSANSSGCSLPDKSAPIVNILSSGTCRIYATVTEGSNHLSTSSEVQSFNIGKAKLNLNWTSPKPIVFGTPLSNIQLNPTANVPGKFTFQPQTGTILPVGKQKLVALFEPTSSAFHENGQVETIIEVLEKIEPVANAIVTSVNKAGKTDVRQINTLTKIEVASLGKGIDRATIIGSQILVYPKRDFAGKTNIVTTSKYFGQIVTTEIDVTVLPEQVTGATHVMKSFDVAAISWKSSKGASTYEVQVNGENLCVTTGNFCELNRLIGPASTVSVTAKAADSTTATSTVAKYTKPVTPLLAIVRNFDTASSELKDLAKADLEDFALAVKKEGFTSLVVYGHTDSRQGIDNILLSQARAQSAIDFLQPLLPSVDFTVGFFAEGRPVASNGTDPGRAANRRVEIFLGG